MTENYFQEPTKQLLFLFVINRLWEWCFNDGFWIIQPISRVLASSLTFPCLGWVALWSGVQGSQWIDWVSWLRLRLSVQGQKGFHVEVIGQGVLYNTIHWHTLTSNAQSGGVFFIFQWYLSPLQSSVLKHLVSKTSWFFLKSWDFS